MTVDPLVLMTDVEAATEQLLRTAESLDEGVGGQTVAAARLDAWATC